MSNLKDYTKVVIIALLTALATQLLARVFVKNDLINNAATKNELIIVKEEVQDNLEKAKEEAIEYTDKQIVKYDLGHTKLHTEQKIQLTQIQTDLTIIKDHLINN